MKAFYGQNASKKQLNAHFVGKALGSKSLRFVAWMTPNFLNRASKPYGVISKSLSRGQVLDFKRLASILSPNRLRSL